MGQARDPAFVFSRPVSIRHQFCHGLGMGSALQAAGRIGRLEAAVSNCVRLNPLLKLGNGWVLLKG